MSEPKSAFWLTDKEWNLLGKIASDWLNGVTTADENEDAKTALCNRILGCGVDDQNQGIMTNER